MAKKTYATHHWCLNHKRAWDEIMGKGEGERERGRGERVRGERGERERVTGLWKTLLSSSKAAVAHTHKTISPINQPSPNHIWVHLSTRTITISIYHRTVKFVQLCIYIIPAKWVGFEPLRSPCVNNPEIVRAGGEFWHRNLMDPRDDLTRKINFRNLTFSLTFLLSVCSSHDFVWFLYYFNKKYFCENEPYQLIGQGLWDTLRGELISEKK